MCGIVFGTLCDHVAHKRKRLGYNAHQANA